MRVESHLIIVSAHKSARIILHLMNVYTGTFNIRYSLFVVHTSKSRNKEFTSLPPAHESPSEASGLKWELFGAGDVDPTDEQRTRPTCNTKNEAADEAKRGVGV